MTDEQKIMDYKKQIDSAKTELHQLQGRLESKKEELKEEFGLDSEEDAQKRLLEIKKEKKELEEKFQNKMKAVEEAYEFE